MKYELDPDQLFRLYKSLEKRFKLNRNRHPNTKWLNVWPRIKANPEKAWTLWQMESTLGEPDVVCMIENQFLYMDCSVETPQGRENLVYDGLAEEECRKTDPFFHGSAIGESVKMHAHLLNEYDYRERLQKIGEFDRLTQSWLWTDPAMRAKGLALIGYRDDEGDEGIQVKPVHADSLYKHRGVRLKVLL